MKKAKVLLLAACAVMVLGGCGSNQTKGELKNEFVSISQYKGVEIEKQEVKEITDEAVDEEINRRLEAKATSVDVTDRAVEKGDTANINYVGKKDGVAFDGGSADNHPLEIGSGAFIPGFEDGIIGHKIGETFDLPLKFPEGYKNADLAGKDVIFTVTINSIQAKSIPALDDAFVARVSETSKTVDEYKKEVKAELEENAKLSAESALQNAAWEAVLDNTKVIKYPEGKVEELEEQAKEQYKQYASMYGVEYEEFISQYTGMDMESFEKQNKEAAQDSVKQELAFELICEKEKLTPTDEEYAQEYEKFVEQFGTMYGFTDVETMKTQIGEENLKKMVMQEKVVDWIVENAKQVDEVKKEEK